MSVRDIMTGITIAMIEGQARGAKVIWAASAAVMAAAMAMAMVTAGAMAAMAMGGGDGRPLPSFLISKKPALPS